MGPEVPRDPLGKVRGTKPWVIDRMIQRLPSRIDRGGGVRPRSLWLIGGILIVVLLGAAVAFFFVPRDTSSSASATTPILPTPGLVLTATPTNAPTARRSPTSPATATALATMGPPAPATSTPTSVPPPTPVPVVHKVKSGDTLFAIALKYGVTVDAIKAANGLTSDLLHVGDELIIPPKTP